MTCDSIGAILSQEQKFRNKNTGMVHFRVINNSEDTIDARYKIQDTSDAVNPIIRLYQIFYFGCFAIVL